MDNNFVIEQKNDTSTLTKVYGLLATTMGPTLLAIVLGYKLFEANPQAPFIVLIISFLVSIGLIFALRKATGNTALVLLYVFTFVEGLILSGAVWSVSTNYTNGNSILLTTLAMTAAVFAGMATLGSSIKKDLSGMSSFLFTGLILLIVGSLINLFFQSSLTVLVLSGAGSLLFSLYIMYDVNQIVKNKTTNVIWATVSLYLDIINLFVNLLNIISILSGNRK